MYRRDKEVCGGDCKGCYFSRHFYGGCKYCTYFLVTGRLRGCPAGECDKKMTRKEFMKLRKEGKIDVDKSSIPFVDTDARLGSDDSASLDCIREGKQTRRAQRIGEEDPGEDSYE